MAAWSRAWSPVHFDPGRQKAVWPSTGNYCRGGAYDCALLACPAVAILPEGMSRERFEWLEEIGTDEIIATRAPNPTSRRFTTSAGSCTGTRRRGRHIFNQFEEFGNAIWHYHVTGSFIEEVFLCPFCTGPALVGLGQRHRLRRDHCRR